jgi:hypothetical protein
MDDVVRYPTCARLKTDDKGKVKNITACDCEGHVRTPPQPSRSCSRFVSIYPALSIFLVDHQTL